MKKILTLLIGLIGAPLVAYVAWRFCFMLFTCGVSLWFVTVALIFFALILFFVVLFELSELSWAPYVKERITALCNWRDILRVNVEKHQLLTQEEKDFCLEKIANTMKSVAETKIELSASNIDKRSPIKIVSFVLFMIFAMVFWSGHYQLDDAELYGKVICTRERIFSTSGEVLAAPQENLSPPQVIKRGGSMYILYGNEDGIYSLYDLDGKLVECRDKNDREYY